MCTSSHLKLLESNSTAKEKSIKIIKRKENKKKTDEQRTVIICAAAEKIPLQYLSTQLSVSAKLCSTQFLCSI